MYISESSAFLWVDRTGTTADEGKLHASLTFTDRSEPQGRDTVESGTPPTNPRVGSRYGQNACPGCADPYPSET